MNNYRNLLWVVIVLTTSCGKADLVFEEEIASYGKEKGYLFTDTLGVYVYFQDRGEEEKPVQTQIITFEYTAKYLDDAVFDASPADAPAKIVLSTAIPGLRKGLALFGRKGKGVIVIPPGEAYGNNAPFGVREGEVLVYEVRVEDFY